MLARRQNCSRSESYHPCPPTSNIWHWISKYPWNPTACRQRMQCWQKTNHRTQWFHHRSGKNYQTQPPLQKNLDCLEGPAHRVHRIYDHKTLFFRMGPGTAETGIQFTHLYLCPDSQTLPMAPRRLILSKLKTRPERQLGQGMRRRWNPLCLHAKRNIEPFSRGMGSNYKSVLVHRRHQWDYPWIWCYLRMGVWQRNRSHHKQPKIFQANYFLWYLPPPHIQPQTHRILKISTCPLLW